MYSFVWRFPPARLDSPSLTMDPRQSAQDVLRCALCRDAVAPLYCNVCHIHLFGNCVAKHFSYKSKIHNAFQIEQFLSTLKCPTHPAKQCELQCEQCNTPICISCISSWKHIGHNQVDIFEALESKKEVLRRDIQKHRKWSEQTLAETDISLE